MTSLLFLVESSLNAGCQQVLSSHFDALSPAPVCICLSVYVNSLCFAALRVSCNNHACWH